MCSAGDRNRSSKARVTSTVGAANVTITWKAISYQQTFHWWVPGFGLCCSLTSWHSPKWIWALSSCMISSSYAWIIDAYLYFVLLIKTEEKTLKLHPHVLWVAWAMVSQGQLYCPLGKAELTFLHVFCSIHTHTCPFKALICFCV